MTRRADRPASDASDELARRAARLVHEGLAPDLAAAIRELGGSPRCRGLARRHLEAMAAVEAAAAGAPGPTAEALDVAIAIMEAIEDLESRTADRGIPYRGVRLAGHAATGRIAPGEVVTIRYHGDRDLDDLEPELEDLGVVELRRSSFQSRWGVLSTIEGDLDGVPFRVRRCPLGQVPLDAGQLKSGRPITLADLPAVIRRRQSFDA
jgi:hypothetical protein